jgi:hypothetical protein
MSAVFQNQLVGIQNFEFGGLFEIPNPRFIPLRAVCLTAWESNGKVPRRALYACTFLKATLALGNLSSTNTTGCNTNFIWTHANAFLHLVIGLLCLD